MDYFSLVANLLGDVLLKKSVAAYQHRAKIRRKFDSPNCVSHGRLSLGAHVK